MCVRVRRAQLLLHDPHMNVRDPGCASLHQVSKAARAILDLMYGLSSTSYDVSLLDQLAFVRTRPSAHRRSARAED